MAALCHGTTTPGKHGSDTSSAHPNSPKGASAHHRARAHSTCPPITEGFSYKELLQQDNFEELKRIDA